MPTIRIFSIKAQYILSNEDYNYIVDNLNKDLPLMSVNFTHSGRLWSIAIYTDEGCISLFVDENMLEFSINYGTDN